MTERLGQSKRSQLRSQVFELKGKVCVYCGGFATTIDHVIPVSRGGENTVENCEPACSPCNRQKSNKMATDVYVDSEFRSLTALARAAAS